MPCPAVVIADDRFRQRRRLRAGDRSSATEGAWGTADAGEWFATPAIVSSATRRTTQRGDGACAVVAGTCRLASRTSAGSLASAARRLRWLRRRARRSATGGARACHPRYGTCFRVKAFAMAVGLVNVGRDRRKGDYMTAVLCHCRVADYDAWRRGYDHALKVTPGVRSFRAWARTRRSKSRDGRGDFRHARAGGGGMDVGRDTGGNGGGWHRHVIAVGGVLRRGRRRRAGSRIAAGASVDSRGRDRIRSRPERPADDSLSI